MTTRIDRAVVGAVGATVTEPLLTVKEVARILSVPVKYRPLLLDHRRDPRAARE